MHYHPKDPNVLLQEAHALVEKIRETFFNIRGLVHTTAEVNAPYEVAKRYDSLKVGVAGAVWPRITIHIDEEDSGLIEFNISTGRHEDSIVAAVKLPGVRATWVGNPKLILERVLQGMHHIRERRKSIQARKSMRAESIAAAQAVFGDRFYIEITREVRADFVQGVATHKSEGVDVPTVKWSYSLALKPEDRLRILAVEGFVFAPAHKEYVEAHRQLENTYRDVIAALAKGYN